MHKDRFCFAAGVCIRSLRRYRVRYLLFALPLLLCTAAAAFCLCITASADRIPDTCLPVYASDGYYLADEDVPDPSLPSVSGQDVQTAEKIGDTYRKIAVLTAFLSVMLAAWFFRFNTYLRRPETAVFLSLGISARTTALSLCAEMLLFVHAVYTAGILLGSGSAYLFRHMLLPPFMQWCPPNPAFVLTGYALLSVLLLLRTLQTYRELNRLSPRRLRNEEDTGGK